MVQLVREIEVNVAYRWFLGLRLTDPVFDASTLSQNRRRRYNDTSVAQDIFDRIVEALDKAVADDRVAHGQKPLKSRERKPAAKETKVSRTDPEAGYMVREGTPEGFFYLDHRTVDGRLGIITDTHATPGNVHDSIVYLGRLDRQRARFDFDTRAVGLDAGYATAGIAQGLEERAILGVTGYRNPTPPKPGMMRKNVFTYEAAVDGYRCPQGQLLTYATTDRSGYRHYTSDPAICRTCPLLASCTANAKAIRTITRHVWQDARERTDAHRLTSWGKAIYSAARRRSNARLPMPSNCTATVTHASEVSCASPASACSPPPPRTSRRSPWRSGRSPLQGRHEAAGLVSEAPETRNSNNPNTQDKTPPNFDGVCQRSDGAIGASFRFARNLSVVTKR